MSLLNFPPEVTLQFIQKMILFDRINLSLAHTKLSPLCFDRSLQRKSTGTLTLNELRQLYEQSKTENEKDQCFKFNVIDKLLIKNFNEVVRLYMDHKNEQFLANGKILHYLQGKFVLVGQEEKFSATFVEQFLCLLEREEGTLLLAFVDVEKLEEKSAKRCAQILSSKLERGQKVYHIEYRKTICFANSFAEQIKNCMDNPFMFPIHYVLHHTVSSHLLQFEKRNIVANTEEIIAMIIGDSLLETKLHLGNFLAVVKAAALQGGGRDILCDNCQAALFLCDEKIFLWVYEPAWTNCADCELNSLPTAVRYTL